MDKETRVKVFEDTITITLNGGYEIGNKTIKFDESDIGGTISYNVKPDQSKIEVQNKKGSVIIVNRDCLYTAEKFAKEGLHVCVLNMASFIRPGGGVLKGSAAQEENLFRRSNLFRSLYRYDEGHFDLAGVNKPIKAYPLPLNYGAIYSPGITVFRYSEDRNYDLMESPFKVDFITVSAIRHPHLTESGELVDWVKDATRSKIKMMMEIPIANKVDVLILGAFGCGAYGTPPEEMAKLFKEVISEKRYKNAFDYIVFSIIDDHNARKEHNPEGNLKPFQRIICG